MTSYRGYEATNIFRGAEKNVLFRCMLLGSVLKVQISLPSSVACASIVRIIGDLEKLQARLEFTVFSHKDGSTSNSLESCADS